MNIILCSSFSMPCFSTCNSRALAFSWVRIFLKFDSKTCVTLRIWSWELSELKMNLFLLRSWSEHKFPILYALRQLCRVVGKVICIAAVISTKLKTNFLSFLSTINCLCCKFEILLLVLHKHVPLTLFVNFLSKSDWM